MSAIKTEPPDARIMPEQILLGAMLSNGAVREGALRQCRIADFHDAFHGRIFQAMADLRAGDHIVNKLGVRSRMDHDPGWKDVPTDYLDDLMTWGRGQTDVAALVTAVRDYKDDPKILFNAMASSIEARPYAWLEPATIPPREWLYGRHLIRKFASGTVAPGGIGKTALGIVEEICMASGRELLGARVANRLRVWSWNLEDPAIEAARRVQAACMYFGVTERDLGGRLFTSSGRDQPCTLAQMDREGAYIVQPVADKVISELKAKRIDVLRIDPFVSSHRVTENNNDMIDLVVKEWAKIADFADCAIDLVHHTRKLGGTEASDESARGAVAFRDACRSVRVLSRMTKEEGEKAGVENHRLYFRGFNDKANLAPPVDASDWYKLEDVDLGNGPPSDHVGVVVPWKWPNAFDNIPAGTLLLVQKRIAAGEYRESPQAKKWAGHVVADVLNLDISSKSDKAKCCTIIKSWIKGGALKVVNRLDQNREPRDFIEVGQWNT